DVMWNQWKCFVAQYQFGTNVWDILLSGATPVSLSPGPKEEHAVSSDSGAQDTLENRTRERVSKGLAPPREIYDVRNRERFDWSKVPDWARPVDPEAFEGCAHEGWGAGRPFNSTGRVGKYQTPPGCGARRPTPECCPSALPFRGRPESGLLPGGYGRPAGVAPRPNPTPSAGS